MPLSANGLWDADTTAARSKLSRRASTDAAGVGRTPAEHRVPSPGGDPGGEGLLQHRARLARVADDQDLRALGLGLQRRRAAQPHGEVRGEQLAHGAPDAIGPEESPLRHARRTLALGELRPLAGLLEAGLAALLDPRVAGQHAPALELGAKPGSTSQSARAMPWRTAAAWPEMPPPWTRTRTSTLPS